MAFPSIHANSLSGSSTGSTTLALTYPTGIVAGDKLIVCVTFDGQPTTSGWPAGWVQEASVVDATNAVRVQIYEKNAVGTETGSFNVTISASEAYIFEFFRISGADSTSIEVTTATGSSTNPNPPVNDPAGWATEDTLWIAYSGGDGGTTTYTAAPTSYGTLVARTVSNAANGVCSGYGSRQNTIGSEDPAVFTRATEQWVAATIAIRTKQPQIYTDSGTVYVDISGTSSDVPGNFFYGTTAVNQSGGGTNWLSPSDGVVTDGVEASVSLGLGNVSNHLVVTGYNLGLPTSGYQVDGLRVLLMTRCSLAIPDSAFIEVAYNGTPLGTGKLVPYTVTNAPSQEIMVGGTSDNWTGAGFTPAMFNDGLFEVHVSVQEESGGGTIVYVDSVAIAVTISSTATAYTDSGTVTVDLQASSYDLYQGSSAVRGSYFFNGNTAYEAAPFGTTMDRPYTVGVWIKPYWLPSDSVQAPASLGRNAAGAEGALPLLSGPTSAEAYEEYNSDFETRASGVAWPADQWNSLVAAFVSHSSRKVYVNGASGGEGTGSMATPMPDHNRMYLGKFPDGSWDYRGWIAYLFIWEYELTAAEITAWHNGDAIHDPARGKDYWWDLTIQPADVSEFEDVWQATIMSSLATAPIRDTGNVPPVVYKIPAIETGTVYLDITPSGTDVYTPGGAGTAYTDTGTIYVDLQISSTDVKESVDADTVYMDLQTSAVEIREFADANTVYVDLQLSAVELREFVDAATVVLALQPSSTDIREIFDANTIYVDLQTSSTDFREGTDAATATVILTPSSSEVLEAVDSNSVYMDLQPSGVDVYTPSGGITYTDADTVYVDLQLSSTEFRESLDSGTVYVDLQVVTAAPGTTLLDNFNRADSATLGSNWTKVVSRGNADMEIVGNEVLIAAGERASLWNVVTYEADQEASLTVTAISYNSGRHFFLLTANNPSSSTYTGYLLEFIAEFSGWSANIYRATANSFSLLGAVSVVPYGGAPFGIGDVWTGRKVGDQLSLLRNGVLFAGPYTDPSPLTGSGYYLGFGGNGSSGTKVDDFTIASTTAPTDTFQGVDTGTVYVDLQPDGVDTYTPSGGIQYTDAGTIYVDLQTSGTEGREGLDTSTIPLALTPSGTDVSGFVDTNSIYIDVTPSGVDGQERVDATQVYVDLQTSSLETIVYTEAGTVSLVLTPTSTDTRQAVDSATPVVKLTPSGVEFLQGLDLPYDTLLVGVLSRHWSATLTGQFYSGSISDRRYAGSMTRKFGGILGGTRFSGALGSSAYAGAISRLWSGILGRK